LVNGIGLSAVKTPFLELSLRERGTKSYSGAAGKRSNVGGLPRSGNPMPGLQWLKNDTIIRNDDPDVDSKTSPTFPADEEYISFFEENVSKSNEYAETVAGIQSFLKQARVLSRCLNTYVEKIPDSALPLVDIKPVLESLFETHDRMKKAEPGALIPDSFRSKVTEVIANVNSKFPGTCTDEKQQDTFNSNLPLMFSPIVRLFLRTSFMRAAPKMKV
jgi:hypothetical protein